MSDENIEARIAAEFDSAPWLTDAEKEGYRVARDLYDKCINNGPGHDFFTDARAATTDTDDQASHVAQDMMEWAVGQGLLQGAAAEEESEEWFDVYNALMEEVYEGIF